jgi:hypothetical protein
MQLKEDQAELEFSNLFELSDRRVEDTNLIFSILDFTQPEHRSSTLCPCALPLLIRIGY